MGLSRTLESRSQWEKLDSVLIAHAEGKGKVNNKRKNPKSPYFASIFEPSLESRLYL